jgi:hypothetical protein
MIVATRPLIDCCPVVPSAIEGRQIAHWDKDSCADAGFLKIDLLGLGMLSAVERCVEQIDARRGERIDLSRIPYDDAQVYEAIQRGETTGVFQIESRAQIASLRRTRPTNLDEITIQVAIVRPGPIQGGAVNPYIKRRQALNANPDFKIPYPHHSLEPILRETLGTIIFQDQVIEVAMAFAGFSAADAAGLRRAMSRKRSAEAIESHRRGFIEGAMARWPDVDETHAAEVFEMVAGFAGFGFPKAHAAAFGLLAYQSTWLRVHYGPELLAALLDEQPMGFYPPDSLVHEAQRRGTTVLAPDLNESALGCLIDEKGALRLGLRHVRGVRKEQLEELIEERSANGPFASLSDLTARAGGARSSLEALAWAGACDRLGDASVSASVGASASAGVGVGVGVVGLAQHRQRRAVVVRVGRIELLRCQQRRHGIRVVHVAGRLRFAFSDAKHPRLPIRARSPNRAIAAQRDRGQQFHRRVLHEKWGGEVTPLPKACALPQPGQAQTARYSSVRPSAPAALVAAAAVNFTPRRRSLAEAVTRISSLVTTAEAVPSRLDWMPVASTVARSVSASFMKPTDAVIVGDALVSRSSLS